MSRRRTTKAGVKARFFAVVYARSELDAHNVFVMDLTRRGVWSEFLGSGPTDDGRFSMTFALPEEEGDAYVRWIRAARRSFVPQAPAH